MKNKVAIITGSTSGIRLGIAKNFTKNGMKIIINGFTPPNTINEIKNDLKKCGAEDILSWCRFIKT